MKEEIFFQIDSFKLGTRFIGFSVPVDAATNLYIDYRNRYVYKVKRSIYLILPKECCRQTYFVAGREGSDFRKMIIKILSASVPM
jgi:hypothetical protein